MRARFISALLFRAALVAGPLLTLRMRENQDRMSTASRLGSTLPATYAQRIGVPP